MRSYAFFKNDCIGLNFLGRIYSGKPGNYNAIYSVSKRLRNNKQDIKRINNMYPNPIGEELINDFLDKVDLEI